MHHPALALLTREVRLTLRGWTLMLVLLAVGVLLFFAAPAMLAARAKAPVHVVALIREPDGRYVLRITPRLSLDTEGALRARVLENSQRCQDAVEALVRAYPEQWLWIHRRWKPRPRFEQEWALKQARDKARAGEQG